jgi:hypothetical protein
MSSDIKEIQETVEKIFVSGSYLYSEYIYAQLKKTDTLNFIKKIIDTSAKTPSEAIFVLLSAIRYIQKDNNALLNIEKNNSFEQILKEFAQEIMDISISKKVQGNGPERGLPILEIFGKKLFDSSICVIELGSSYGLIGNCLLNSKRILENRNSYFLPSQKMPDNPKGADFYLGIDIDPPEMEWLLACFFDPSDANRINKFIINGSCVNNIRILKASANGFSELKEVRELAATKYKLVILTSFMLYQLKDAQQELLKKEIREFTRKNNGHWICQEVEFYNGQPDLAKYYIEWDEEKIINLDDDKCTSWKWLN